MDEKNAANPIGTIHVPFGRTTEPQRQKPDPTYRFDIKLDPSENGYAEVNYMDLVAGVSASDVPTDVETPTFPLPSSTRCQISDDTFYHFKVSGYDTADSFIDDSEAFDEYLQAPSPSAPKGFYVNYRSCKSNRVADGKSSIKKTPKTTTEMEVVKKIEDGKSVSIETPKNAVQVEVEKENGKENKERKRPKPSSQSDVIVMKKMKSCDEDEEIQIIGETIRTPLSSSQNNSIKKKVMPINNLAKVCPELPANLSIDLLKSIRLLKQEIIACKSRRISLFNEQSNKLLLNVQVQLLPLSLKMQSNVYSHLSHQFSLSIATLKKKVKILVIRKLTSELTEAILKLAGEIKNAELNLDTKGNKSSCGTPSLVPECLPAVGKSDDLVILGTYPNQVTVKRIHVPEVQENVDVNPIAGIKLPSDLSIAAILVEDPLTPIIKTLLFSIFAIKKKLFDCHRIRKMNFLEYLVEFLKDDIINMWMPAQINLESLVGLANEFCGVELSAQLPNVTLSLEKTKVPE